MGFYTHTKDKKSGDGLALTEWNDLSNAVAGNSGLTLAMKKDTKVGIATDEPISKLTVKDSGYGITHINKDEKGDDKIEVGTYLWDDAGGIGTKSKHPFSLFAYDSTEILTIATNGNVGIGTTSPTEKLTVKSNYYGILHIDTAKKIKVSTFVWADRGGIGTKSKHPFSLFADGRNKTALTVTVDGNVGIGTTSPATGNKLEVNGNVQATKFIGDGSGLTNLSVGLNGLNLATSGGNVSIGTKSPIGKLTVKTDDNNWGIIHMADSVQIGTYIWTDSAAIGTKSNHDFKIITNNSDTAALTISKDSDSNQVYINKDGTWIQKLYIKSINDSWFAINGIAGKTNRHHLYGSSGEAKDDKLMGNNVLADGVNPTTFPSDARLKKDITPISSPLEKIGQLNGVTYGWNEEGEAVLTSHTDRIVAGPGATEEENQAARDNAKQKAKEVLKGTIHTGLLGQDIQKVAPDLVHEAADGYLRVEYSKIVALLVEGIKEQQQTIKKLEQQQAETKARLENLAG